MICNQINNIADNLQDARYENERKHLLEISRRIWRRYNYIQGKKVNLTGRPPIEFDLEKVEQITAESYSNLEIAKKLKINRNTFTNHKNQDEDFAKAYLRGLERRPKVTKGARQIVAFRLWVNKRSTYLASLLSKLNLKDQKRVREGILLKIQACRKIGKKIQLDTIREIIEDAKKGLFYFEEMEKERQNRASLLQRDYSEQYTNFDDY